MANTEVLLFGLQPPRNRPSVQIDVPERLGHEADVILAQGKVGSGESLAGVTKSFDLMCGEDLKPMGFDLEVVGLAETFPVMLQCGDCQAEFRRMNPE